MRLIATELGQSIISVYGGVAILVIFGIFFFGSCVFTQLIVDTLNFGI